MLESALTDPHLEMIFGLRPLLLSPSCVLRHLDRFHLFVLGPRSSFSLSLRSSDHSDTAQGPCISRQPGELDSWVEPYRRIMWHHLLIVVKPIPPFKAR